MTPDRGPCYRVMSRQRSLNTIQETWFHDESMDPLSFVGGLASVALLLTIRLKVSTALSEIVVGTVAQLVIGVMLGTSGLQGNTQWITFLAGTGAIVLTFLAGADLDPAIFKTKWREALVVGIAGFFGPFLGCTAIDRTTPQRNLTRGLSSCPSLLKIDSEVLNL